MCPGISVRLKNSQLERYSEFDTQIIYVDEKRGMISVHYTEDAKILHSKKYFSVAPLQPVPINLMVPSIQSSDELFNGKILELNSVRMMVFSEENIPINKCLAVNFTLPDGDLISTPLVIIQKSKEKLIFGIEFVMIDEKERAKIIQYMYKRQIEMVKQHS
ncbi:MAG: hypothetical protein HOC71_10115 [Candidatus Latescibacteria bacterium]|nr:hypothetical protein [Candidatus Latescibacterota bacterium]